MSRGPIRSYEVLILAALFDGRAVNADPSCPEDYAQLFNRTLVCNPIALARVRREMESRGDAMLREWGAACAACERRMFDLLEGRVSPCSG